MCAHGPLGGPTGVSACLLPHRHDGIEEIAKRFRVGTGVLHMGAANVPAH
jgi:hypothetical protein